MESFAAEHRQRFWNALDQCVHLNIDGAVLDLGPWCQSVVDQLESLRQIGGRLYLVGNGASASLANHFAADFTKTTRLPAQTFYSDALLTCFANDHSYEDAFARMLDIYFKPGDGLIVISSSGDSPNVVRAAQRVLHQEHSAMILLTGFSANNALHSLPALRAYAPSREYGIVESVHGYLLHLMLDAFHRSHPG